MWHRAAAPTSRMGFEPNNHLLAALPSSDVQSLQPHLEVTPLARGSVLCEVDEPLTLRAERALPAGVLWPRDRSPGPVGEKESALTIRQPLAANCLLARSMRSWESVPATPKAGAAGRGGRISLRGPGQDRVAGGGRVRRSARAGAANAAMTTRAGRIATESLS